jgi:hypothetical protein
MGKKRKARTKKFELDSEDLERWKEETERACESWIFINILQFVTLYRQFVAIPEFNILVSSRVAPLTMQELISALESDATDLTTGILPDLHRALLKRVVLGRKPALECFPPKSSF